MSLTPTAAGTYHWVAVYSGSSPNTYGTTHNADCADANEDVVVNTVKSTLETAQTWLPNASATVSAPAGSGDLDGTVPRPLRVDGLQRRSHLQHHSRRGGRLPRDRLDDEYNRQGDESGSYSWKVSYDSDNLAQEDIPASCEETSVLTVDNGDPVTHPLPHVADRSGTSHAAWVSPAVLQPPRCFQ